uniref:Uncharacterized protein n=1 Tax=Gasterosteus aculeatus aculeatus TaxID=481459 RepID=A0AAQ4QKT0_GASAC
IAVQTTYRALCLLARPHVDEPKPCSSTPDNTGKACSSRRGSQRGTACLGRSAGICQSGKRDRRRKGQEESA